MADNSLAAAGGSSRAQSVRDDRILPETRFVAFLIPPFLIVAFIMLYFFPQDGVAFNGTPLFAWTIKPEMTPLFMGGGYISGSYFFVRMIMGGKWHWFTHGLPSIAVFTWFMGLATLLHLDRFNTSHISFYAWSILYLVTPFVVPAIWLRNRGADPGTPDPDVAVVPPMIRMVARIVGAVLLLIALFMFIFPSAAISIWPWTLTQLTARVVGGWFALPGMVGIMTSTDSRWSSWKILIESQSIALVLILISTARAWSNFDTSNPLTWVFIAGIALLLLAVGTLYFVMQSMRGKQAVQEQGVTG